MLCIKMLVMSLFTSYSNKKVLNLEEKINYKWAIMYIITAILYICMSMLLNREINTTIFTLICISIIYTIIYKFKIMYSMLISAVSISINQILFYIASTFIYFPMKLLNIENRYLAFILIALVQAILLFLFWKIKRIRNGITFLKKWKNDEYINLLLLNASSAILFLIVIISNYQEGITSKFGVMLIIFAIVMFITIWKSLQLYYKQQMLEKVLEKTQKDLADKTEEVKKLEAENLSFSEISHSIAHRQDSLKHKLEKLSKNTEFADEISINAQIDNITKDLRKKTKIELEKTGIEIVDDMLDCMQAKCVENDIDFQLQINGNIYHMINNYIPKEDLEILLADHIKDAIIAINHCENINKSILVKIGKIDDIYGVYFYDSGIEFEFNTLLNLGKIPITTHKSEGGTGMGFMNTFKTLSKTKGSLEIEEIGKPSKSNFTKVLKFKFNNKNEYKIISYKGKELKEKDEENKLIIENIER